MIDLKIELPEGLEDHSTDPAYARMLMEAEFTKVSEKKPRHKREENDGKKRARARYNEKRREERFYKRLAKGLVHVDTRGWQWRKQADEFGIVSMTPIDPGPVNTAAKELIEKVLHDNADPIAVAAIKSVLESS